jgi:hypothetical protein
MDEADKDEMGDDVRVMINGWFEEQRVKLEEMTQSCGILNQV